jgi:hypothetical protein
MVIKAKTITCICLFCIGLPAAYAQTKWVATNSDLKVRIIARSQDQMAAFYEARGFPRKAVKQLKQFCFFTIGITNKSHNIIHHDLEKWSFTSTDSALKRVHRNTLKTYWLNAGLEKRLISTFRWTLLPENLDFRPQESEGGNIVVTRSQQPFNIHAVFNKEDKNRLKIINVEINDVMCADKVK